MPPISTAFISFFLASLCVLFLIFCVKLPDLVRWSMRLIRQLSARRSRKDKILSDMEELMRDSRRLEGIYCFDNVEPHSTPTPPASLLQEGLAESSSHPVSSSRPIVAR